MSGPFDHRASIVAYLEELARKKEDNGQRSAATELRAASGSIMAMLDVEAGRRGIAGPVEAIIRTVAARMGGATYAEIVGHSKGGPDCSKVRYAAMWVASKRLGWDQEKLGLRFNRDRSTVSNGIRRAEDLRRDDDRFHRITESLLREDIRCEHCLMPLIPA